MHAARLFDHERAAARHQLLKDKVFDAFFHDRIDTSFRKRACVSFLGSLGLIGTGSRLLYRRLGLGLAEPSQRPVLGKLDLPAMRQPTEQQTIASAKAYVHLAAASETSSSQDEPEPTLALVTTGWGGFPALYDATTPVTELWRRMEDGLYANPQLLQHTMDVPRDDRLGFASAIANVPSPPESMA